MPSFKWIVAVGAVACVGQSSHAALILTNAVAHWDFGTVAAPTPAAVAAHTPTGLTLGNITATDGTGADALFYGSGLGGHSTGSFAMALATPNPFTFTLTVAKNYELTLTHMYVVGAQTNNRAGYPNGLGLRGPAENGGETNWGAVHVLPSSTSFREYTTDFPDRTLTEGSYTFKLFTSGGTRLYNIDNYTFYGSMEYVEPAPEPATLGLAAAGLACLLSRRQRP